MDYIKRIEELERNAKNITLQQDVKQAVKPMIVCKGFIGKNAIIKPYSMQGVGFTLDDDSIYRLLVSERSKNSSNSFASDVSLIQNILDKYFVGGTKEVVQVYMEEHNNGRDIHSIKKYRGRGGQCIQKSALASNMLQILGYDCEMVWSNVGSENHAFLIVHSENKHFIYDPTNRSKMSYPLSGGYVKIPTLVEKSEKDINDFYNGISDLEINEQDEKIKNQKQHDKSINIVLPRMRYSCRQKTNYINLSESALDKYISSLRSRGLNDEEINNLINRINEDVRLGVVPKVDSLLEVYEEIRNGSGMHM